ncbi:hypothetical protein EMIHUDRAFT_199289 [Emiliania huxleyi CCMP1516]|uniref:Uncharacterized protein n=2 Tax=Emiliania huxleyi TaxID=2903 RepID=A0A0D3I2L1_EMIH1|nr:hypothetical protein EMIHUDRAFT_199289 [Emiliania huxleyi CCMP1516]EOD05496.1 hypothetical protein EMIHUDRAFT_199289 [Emiliania huxleyi CCMP1516]|eukprot:XP_005757925.1 hypothetical protein EMIHUDRAFT_199289 [Emiliania huxleyi CCMP1516]
MPGRGTPVEEEDPSGGALSGIPLIRRGRALSGDTGLKHLRRLPESAIAPVQAPPTDEAVLERVSAVLRRHPSFARQIVKHLKTAGPSPPTTPPTTPPGGGSPSPFKVVERRAWFSSPLSASRSSGGATTPAAASATGSGSASIGKTGRSTSAVEGAPSTRGWRPVWRRSFYVVTTLSLVALSRQVYTERRKRLEYETLKARSRTFGQAVRSALTMQTGLIVVNLVLAARGVQIWRLIHNLQVIEWVQRLAPAMPVTTRVVDGVKATVGT